MMGMCFFSSSPRFPPYSYPCLPLFISFSPSLSSLPGTFSSSTVSVPPFSFSFCSSSTSYKFLPSSHPLSVSPLFPSPPLSPLLPTSAHLFPSSSVLSSSFNYLSFSSLLTPLIAPPPPSPASSFLLSLFLLWYPFSNLFFLHPSSIIYLFIIHFFEL